ncbi:MAG: DinB family protein [Anaerolineales bacterium]|jgi:uncharacterized damage-inducible protein DinB
MSENILIRLFEHNNWANQKILQVCTTLSDDQLDAEPQSATRGTIRTTLAHLASGQRGYLTLLTATAQEQYDDHLPFTTLEEVLQTSGEGLLDLVKEADHPQLQTRLRTKDGYAVEPWVVLLQAINHAGEHREQICSMLTALGVTPPDLDGWSYGEATGALVPVQKT